MTAINAALAMCIGSIALSFFLMVLGRNIARLVRHALGGPDGDY